MAVTFSGITSAVLMAVCLYFTLSFFQYLKEGNDHLAGQAKKGAVISLALGLLVSAIVYV
ncbi:hypothetical protein V1502_11170 [Bacillus sp. SCS-153A]|uniref:hypothetical protein n=1 Tax=Rossellomorea sedimentorum TaxID=3115294 RepID=UPI003906C300